RPRFAESRAKRVEEPDRPDATALEEGRQQPVGAVAIEVGGIEPRIPGEHPLPVLVRDLHPVVDDDHAEPAAVRLDGLAEAEQEPARDPPRLAPAFRRLLQVHGELRVQPLEGRRRRRRRLARQREGGQEPVERGPPLEELPEVTLPSDDRPLRRQRMIAHDEASVDQLEVRLPGIRHAAQADQLVVVLHHVVPGEKREEDEIGAILRALVQVVEQLVVRPERADAGVDDLDGMRHRRSRGERALDALRDALFDVDLVRLDERVAEDEHAEATVPFVWDIAIAEAVPVDARVRAPFHVPVEAVLAPASRARREAPAIEPIRLGQDVLPVDAPKRLRHAAERLGKDEPHEYADRRQREPARDPGGDARTRRPAVVRQSSWYSLRQSTSSRSGGCFVLSSRYGPRTRWSISVRMKQR